MSNNRWSRNEVRLFMRRLSMVIITITTSIGCKSLYNKSTNADTKGLKDYYKNYFPIGVAVNTHNLTGNESKLILKEFNSLTAENDMKMGPIHPSPNRYNWRNADSIVRFAQKHHLKLRGHNLCWYKQTPDWIFVDHYGNTVSKDSLLRRLKSHIATVVDRYKNSVYAWDVVNEAVSDKDTSFLRNSKWLQICGEDFIDSAFCYAHEADPHAQLFYNDYNIINPQKRTKIYRLLKGLLNKGIPITGVGIQAHWSLTEPTREALETTIKLFASLGLKVQITELDISTSHRWNAQQKGSLVERKRISDSLEALKYKMVFEVFRKYKKYINGVTFWNLSDKYTWLNHYPLRGMRNYPLLFDTLLNRKAAYWGVVNW
ncbi:endo-1,4-beta-xylanase [Arachidicoccus soli]|nr:endo-1,4-beta-xylanase [Arachidicoccus soli]